MEKRREIYSSKLQFEKAQLAELQHHLKNQKIKLASLEIQKKEENRAKKIKIENERIAKHIESEKKKKVEKKRQELALAKKGAEEKKRIALASKRKKEKERRELELRKKRLAKLKESKQNKELKELEKIDLLESDQLSEETALFLENSQSRKLFSLDGFKPLNKWFKASAGFSSTLNNIKDNDYGREALKATIMVNPYSYFFAGTTMSFDLNKYKNIYYQPNFSYSFGYSDWHLDTFEFIYSNYANNKFAPKEGESRFNFQSGTWEASYKTKVDKVKLSAKVKYVPINNRKKLYIKAKTVVGDNVMVSAQLKHTLNTHQNRVTLSAKTFVYDSFFLSSSAYIYPESELQRSSDPDYAFSFGWKDSKPFHPSITYSNYYTPTRWDNDEGPKFKDATVSIKFNLKF